MDFLFSQLEKVRKEYTALEYSNLQNELVTLLEKKDKKPLYDFFKKVGKGKPSSFEDAFNFLDYASFEKKEEEGELPRYKQGLVEGICSSFLAGNDKVVLKDNHPLEEVKQIAYDIYEQLCAKGEHNIIPFILANNCKLEGMITGLVYMEKLRVKVGEVYGSRREIQLAMQCYGGSGKGKGYTSITDKYISYYVYTFKTPERRYMVFSEEVINPGPCTITGMQVEMRDSNKVGENARISSSIPIIYTTSIEPDIPSISTEVFRKIARKAKGEYETIAGWLFGKFRHPQWFEKLLFSQMFSYPYNGYPLHIGIVGPPGTAKTPILLLLQSHFKEVSGIFQGANSTMKGLIPSFFASAVNEGYLAQCRRYGLVDEFFGCLERSRRAQSNFDESGLLRNILEWNNEPQRSGTRVIKVDPRMRCVFVSNWEGSTKDFVSAAKHYNVAFLSRVLWYSQSQEHVEYILENKKKFQNEDKTRVPRVKELVMLHDYLTKIKLSPNVGKCNDIYRGALKLVPSALLPIYKAKVVHHVACLVDGLAKLNSLVEGRKVIKVTDSDYVEAAEIWNTVIRSWGITHMGSLPPRIRVGYYYGLTKELWDLVCNGVGSTRSELKTSFPLIYQYLPRLLEDKTVYEFDKRIYPFWSNKVKKILEIESNVQKQIWS